ncbi:MAG: NAD-dependent epimerase/dehydratase [Candidatus Acidiferrum sp.]
MDFALIHLAMLLAMVISIAYQGKVDGWLSSREMMDAFRHYYFHAFLPLSPLFPLVFFLNGLYTYVRSYSDKAKLRRFVAVVLLSCIVFIGANFLLWPVQNPVGRSVALPFAVLAVACLLAARAGKEWLIGVDRAERTVQKLTPVQAPVLVLGGAGYVGSWLVGRLLESGQRVRVLDSAIYGLGAIQNLLDHPNLEFLHGDCRNIQDVVKAMRGISSVVHLAAIVGDPACELDRKTTIEINYAATRMLVEIAKGHGVERFLFASSCSVYGATDELMDENSQVEPISLFLSARAYQDRVITIYNGQQWRPFVHVKDLAEAIILLLRAPVHSVSGEIFNIGDNRLNHTLDEVGNVIKEIFPGTRVEAVENSDRRNYRVNFNKIRDRVAFHSRYSLADGVREIKLAFESNQIVDYKDVKFSNLVFLREWGSPENKSDFDAEIMAVFGGDHIRRVVAAANLEMDLPKAKTAVAN